MTDPQLAASPGQTIGPFFGYALPYAGDHSLVPASHPDAVHLTGLVLDGEGAPVPDALLEIWQADPTGRILAATGSLHRDEMTFTGWGRSATDNNGRYGFHTLRPGPTEATAAPFIAVAIFARGLLDRLFTRIYLPGDDARLASDPLLRSLAPARRQTLVASDEAGQLRFDVRLQGSDETVFLDYTSHQP